MFRLRNILPIVAALLIALGTSYFLYKWVNHRIAVKTVGPVTEVETKEIIVAASDLPWGTKIKPEMIKSIKYLSDNLPKGVFSNPDRVTDRVLITPVAAYEQILESKLAPEDVKSGGVAALITAGKRAQAVKGDKVIGLAGFIKPGNFVDVLMSTDRKDPDSGKRTRITKIILENIRVLATGTELEENEKGETLPVDVYTLEVNPDEGEMLALADSQGKLQFALRNTLDSGIVLTAGATIDETLSSYSGPKDLEIIPSTPKEIESKPPVPEEIESKPMKTIAKYDDTQETEIYIPPVHKIQVIKGVIISSVEF